MKPHVLFLSSRDARHTIRFEGSRRQVISGIGNNTGNVLFTNAVQKYLQQQGTPYDVVFYSPKTRLEVDWSRYSHCVINVANWLSLSGKSFLEKIAVDFDGVRCPTYLIGLGAQAPNEASVSFIDAMKNEAHGFIRAILETGGSFGLRGEFTAACFDRLGFSSEYTVTGCPSVYQSGAFISLPNKRVTREEFRPAVNGHTQMRDIGLLSSLAHEEGGIFICQDDLLHLLHFFRETGVAQRRNFLSYPEPLLKLVKDGRVKIYANLQEWITALNSSRINFSVGGRVHGNIAALLAGIPACFVPSDSRTSELIDFFGFGTAKGIGESKDLYEMYLASDNAEFQRRLPELHRSFAETLEAWGLPMSPPMTRPDAEPIGLDSGETAASDTISPELSEYLEEYLRFSPILPSRVASKRKQFIAMRSLRTW